MKINKNVSWVENENELYIINTITNKCIILDDIGRKLWFILVNNPDLQELIKTVQWEYNRSEFEKIKQDVTEFYNLLLSMEIIGNDENV